MVAEIEADMAAQLERVREMKKNGELEPIPEVSAAIQYQPRASNEKAPEVLTTPGASFLGSGGGVFYPPPQRCNRATRRGFPKAFTARC